MKSSSAMTKIAVTLGAMAVGLTAVASGDAERHASVAMNAVPAQAVGGRNGGVRVLVLGNSITCHYPAPALGWTNNWGMAASAPERDFAHLVVRGIERHLGKPADFRIRSLAKFERGYESYSVERELADDIAWMPDYVVIALGENTPDFKDDRQRQTWADGLRRLAAALRKGNPQAKVVYRTTFWPNEDKREVIRFVAESAGAGLADLGSRGADLRLQARGVFWHAGVACHPNDLGMRMQAERVLQAFGFAEKTHELPELLYWTLHKDKGERSWTAHDVPAKGTYSVKLRLAVLNARDGGRVTLSVDGIRFVSDGVNMKATGGGLEKPRECGIEFRNRRYHELVFIVTEDEIRLFADGAERKAFPKKPGAARAFAVTARNADIEFEASRVVAGDVSENWCYRNAISNGGFEQLANGYPIYWGTQGFGFGHPDDIADLDRARARFRIDDKMAYEGRNSMFVERRKGERSLHLCECWRGRLAHTNYVLSAYLRSDWPGTEVAVEMLQGYLPIAKTVVRPGSEWSRFELPFETVTGSQTRPRFFVASEEGRFWIDAVQLERGKKATPFVAHADPESDLPVHPAVVGDHYYPDGDLSCKYPGVNPRMARVDPVRNSFRLPDGEFFPFGFCLERPVHDMTAYGKMLDCFKAHGFNFFEPFEGGFPKTSELAREMLDAAESRGIKTAFYVGHDPKTFEVDRRKVDILKSVARHPNLLEVAIMDELSERVTAEKRASEATYVRETLGGEVPVMINDCDYGPSARMDYAAADVASMDMYFAGNHDIGCLWHLLRRLRDDNPGRVVTYYAEASGHFTRTMPRDPTPEEVLLQAYIGYSLELFGMCWWIACPLSEPVMPAMAQAKRERDAIDPSRYLDGTPFPVECTSWHEAVKFSARESGQTVTIISVNISERELRAKWKLPKTAKRAKILFEDRMLEIGGETFEDVYRPMERHVYQIEIP